MIFVIQIISREKILRVSFGTFRNLIEHCEAAIEIMVESGLLRMVELYSKTNIKDEELKEDLDFVGQVLEKNLRILTSFDKYLKELNTTTLEWGPVHSDKFWKEHVRRFEDDDFGMIKKLVGLLNSEKTKNQAIACFDLGEFCRYHPFGKK